MQRDSNWQRKKGSRNTGFKVVVRERVRQRQRERTGKKRGDEARQRKCVNKIEYDGGNITSLTTG